MIRILGHVLKGGKLVKVARSKYHAKRATLDGYKFDSQQEAARYAVLRQQEQAGLISDLKVHPLYPLTVQGVTIGSYEADFSYRANTAPRGVLIVEDVKAIQNPLFRWKRKHFEAEYKGCEFRLFDVKDGKMKRWTQEDLDALASRVQAAGEIQ